MSITKQNDHRELQIQVLRLKAQDMLKNMF